MHYIGIDLGGTSIKGAVVTEGGTILKEASCPTQRELGPEHVAREIAGLITALAEGYDPQAIGGVGVGCPGIVEDHSGIVRYSANLHWENFDLRAAVQKYSGYTVRLANDANAAALGEVVAGCAQNVDSAVILTLGTGVGSGVVLNGKILTGCTGGAAELGHMVVEDGGALCACGRKGCFETYASATGLIRMAKEAMAQHPESLLHATAAEVGDVNGQTIFRAKEQGDPTVYYAPMRCALDHWIPFCKWFVIPYAFWFLFVGGMLLYTLFYNIPAFRRMMWFIILTYSFALVTYLLFPNCQHLRPTLLGGDLLTRFTAKLYAADTNTNVCPSIHVIGSFAVYFAARDIRRFRAKGWRLGFLTMAVLISLSTVFLKQHSVLDVLAGLAVCAAAYPLIYRVPAGAASLIPAGGLGRKRFPEL